MPFSGGVDYPIGIGTGGDSGGAKIPEINPAAKVSKQKMKVLGINV